MTRNPIGVGEHYASLDGIRGILAVAVMLFHYGSDTILSHATRGSLPKGAWELCVDFFFILSGFVLCQSYQKRRPGIIEYIIKRALRLFPLFAITTISIIVINFKIPELKVLLSNITLSQSVINLPSINHPAWSISFELYFPILFLFALPFFKSNRRVLFPFFLAGSAACCFALMTGHSLPHARAFFSLGLGFLLNFTTSDWGEESKIPTLYLSFIGCLFILIFGRSIPLLSVALPALSVISIVHGRAGVTLFSSKLILALGQWSYGIYLIHIPVLLAFEKLVGTQPSRHIGAKALMVIATIALAGIAHNLVEQPAIHLSKRIFAKRRPNRITPDERAC